MNKRFFIILILGIISFSGIYAQSEPVGVVRSENKIVIEKNVYYIHIVKPGQTLYSISRVYNVPQKDILMENPNAYIGLQPDQALKIPFMPEADPDKEVSGEDEGKDYIFHTVEPGQTLFFLSRNYNVEIDEIIRLNPEAKDGLQINQIVRIPARKVYISREGFPSEDDKFIHHKVEKGETLYSIAREYDVPVRAIRTANDKLIWGLKYGEYIRIPKDADTYADHVDEYEIEAEPSRTHIYDKEAIVDAECADFNYREFRETYNVVLMLPLFIDRNYPVELPDTVDQEKALELFPDYVTSKDQLFHQTIPFLEFYEGALLAVDSLVSAGLSVELTVYDTQRDIGRVREIIQSREFRNTDLIIGPVYPENIRIVADWAYLNNVNIVSPLTSRSEFLDGNPYLFQVTPSASAEFERASAYISEFPCSNFVLVHNNDPFERDAVEAFKSHIFRQFSYSSDFNDVIFKEVVYTDASIRIEHSLLEEEKNIVIIPSSNQAFVSDVLMRLNILSRTYDITIFGLNDWQRFANIEVEYLHNMELHYAAPFFVDYNNDNVKRFVGNFRNKYKTEPSYYGFQGYDIMFYFLKAMKNYGPDFRDCLPMMQTELLQADFLFRKIDPRDGFENNGISIVKYDRDLNIRRLGYNRHRP